MSGNLRPAETHQSALKHRARQLAQWLLLFGLWVAFSGQIVVEFLVLGALTAAAALAFSELLFRGTHEGMFPSAPPHISWYVRTTLRFLLYIPWLGYEIIVSNLHVTYLVLHPRMPIDPSLVEFATSLQSERAQVLLAQSITLTPGTVTVDASNGKFVIHCLSNQSREGLAEGKLQAKIANVFNEPSATEIVLTDIQRPGQVPL
jgi:multicomponent Na+:H+ antiporter subunit E